MSTLIEQENKWTGTSTDSRPPGLVDTVFSATYSLTVIRLSEKIRANLGLLATAFVACLLCASCEAELPEECEGLLMVPSSLAIGTGSAMYEPIGMTTLFEQGPQGGWHVYASLRATGLFGGTPGVFDETLPLVTYKLNAEDGSLTGGFESQPRAMKSTGNDETELVGEFAVLGIDDPSLAEGIEVTITAKVRDVCGQFVETSTRTRLTESAF